MSQAPAPERKNRGVPPTALKARTGEDTPPGMTARARLISACEALVGADSDGPEAGGSVRVDAIPSIVAEGPEAPESREGRTRVNLGWFRLERGEDVA
ncbi:hypothetical protein GCM10023340_13340 [Nocardioides marinquilinus]|uniref:Uncharacterized protein n=1 Tax=Nocardioides marinquilinus TaxID=1210400 RepID=A0ABP9PDR9_9ACTN